MMRLLQHPAPKRGIFLLRGIALALFAVTTLFLLIDHPAIMAQGKPLTLLFERADTDHNGIVSEQEWHSIMQERFAMLDANKDGSLSRPELEEARSLAQERFRQWRNTQPSR